MHKPIENSDPTTWWHPCFMVLRLVDGVLTASAALRGLLQAPIWIEDEKTLIEGELYRIVVFI